MAKVIILCGGRGTRLKEQTDFMPKPMVPIGNRPILWHIMKIYSHFGFNEFVLTLGYKSEMIKDYFVNYRWMNSNITVKINEKNNVEVHKRASEDWTIHLMDTGVETGTARRIFLVKDLIKDDGIFMVTYGDGVADIDINKLLDYHKRKGLLVTITGYRPVHRFGILEHKDGVVTKFNEKPQMGDLINCGFMVFSKGALRYFDGKDIMLEQLLPTIAKDRQLAVFHHEGDWHSMDTQRDYEELNKLWETNPRWKVWKE